MAQEYLARQPSARRRQEASLLRAMLPSLEKEKGGADIDEGGGEGSSGSYSGGHKAYLEGGDGEDASGGQDMKLLIDLVVSIVAEAFTSNPAQVIVVDDSQFLDSLSWQLVMEVCKVVRPCFVVLGFRPGFHGQTHGRMQELHAEQGLTFISLGPLNADEVQELASRRLRSGKHAPVEISEAFWERVADAQGHPLVVSEVGGMKGRPVA